MEPIQVRVGTIPGGVSEFAIIDATVRGALTAAGLEADGYKINVNGVAANLDTPLRDGDNVLRVRKVVGN